MLAIQEQWAPGWYEEFVQRLTEMATVSATIDLVNVKGPKGRRRLAREAAEALVDGSLMIERDPRLGADDLASGSVVHGRTAAYALPWTILRAKKGASVCSDRPLTMHDPTASHKFSGAAWMSF